MAETPAADEQDTKAVGFHSAKLSFFFQLFFLCLAFILIVVFLVRIGDLVDCICRISLVEIVRMKMSFYLQLYLYLKTTFSVKWCRFFPPPQCEWPLVPLCFNYVRRKIPDRTSSLNDVEYEALNITTCLEEDV